jgi:hypothetical protein
VRRLRYKDGRNMAMRGDDFIGAGYDGNGEKLWLLKGEAKSNKVLGKATVTSARKVLNRDNGRCTPDPCCSSPTACWRATTRTTTRWAAACVTKWV